MKQVVLQHMYSPEDYLHSHYKEEHRKKYAAVGWTSFTDFTANSSPFKNKVQALNFQYLLNKNITVTFSADGETPVVRKHSRWCKCYAFFSSE